MLEYGLVGIGGAIFGALATILIQALRRWRARRAIEITVRETEQYIRTVEARAELGPEMSERLRALRESEASQYLRRVRGLAGEDRFIQRLRSSAGGHAAGWIDSVAPASRPAFPGQEIEERDERVVSLLFATNRKNATHQQGWFNGERASEISYGRAGIRIPEEHRIGKIELPFRMKLFSVTLYEQGKDPKKHFTIRSLQVVSLSDWLRSIEEWDADQALIFVHGFNVSFQDGLNRLAQIVWDLKYAGVPILFSWPSRKRVPDYWYDRESALGARQAFIEVLKNVKAEQSIKKVHILAHSMGNFVVLDALANLNHQLETSSLGELIMAAPDVDRDLYASMAGAVRKIASGMTLYASSADRALALSKRVAGNIPRAGDVPAKGPIVLPEIESIDVTAIGSDILGLNHSTFAEARSILNDVDLLIRTGHRPPDDRLAEIRGVPEGAKPPTYWRYSP